VNVESDGQKLKVPPNPAADLYYILNHNAKNSGFLARAANKRTKNIAKTFMRQIPDHSFIAETSQETTGFHSINSIRSRPMHSADVTTKNSEQENGDNYDIYEKDMLHTPQRGNKIVAM